MALFEIEVAISVTRLILVDAKNEVHAKSIFQNREYSLGDCRDTEDDAHLVEVRKI